MMIAFLCGGLTYIIVTILLAGARPARYKLIAKLYNRCWRLLSKPGIKHILRQEGVMSYDNEYCDSELINYCKPCLWVFKSYMKDEKLGFIQFSYQDKVLKYGEFDD
jgi:hypothetical protein